VTATIGNGDGDVGASEPFKLAFAAPVDHPSIEKALSILPRTDGRIRWDGNTLTFTPVQPWPTATLMTVTVGTGARLASGGAIEQPVTWAFATRPAFDAVEVSPADQAVDVPSNAVINIVFSRPVDTSTLPANLSITPAIAGSIQWAGRTATFVPRTPLPPRSTFSVNVGTGVRSADGDPLPAAKRWRFTTYTPTPASSAQSLSRAGGNVVFAQLDQPHEIAFLAHNVPNVPLTVYRIPSREAFIAAYESESQGKPNSVNLSTFTKLASWDATLSNDAISRVSVPQTDKPGLYYVDERAAGRDQSGQLLIVSSRGALLKRSPTGVLVWITKLTDGTPVAGLPVQVLDAKGQHVAEGTTSDDGVFAGNVPAPTAGDQYDLPELLVFAGTGDDLTVAGTSYDFYASGYTFRTSPMRVYTQTDRPLYRPGQTVHLRGVVRADDDAHYRVPSDKHVRVVVRSPNQQAFVDRQAQLDENGIFAFDVQLPANIPTGDYTIVVAAAGSDLKFANNDSQTVFQVEAYRKPEYAVTVRIPGGPYVSGDQIPINVSATYYFGQPVRGARVSLTVTKTASFDSYQVGNGYVPDVEAGEAASYHFGVAGDQVLTRQGTLADDGTAKFTIPSDLGKALDSQDYQVEATVIDPASNPVSGTASTTIHRGAQQLFLEPSNYVTMADAPNPTVVTVQDLLQHGQPNVPIHCDVLEQSYVVTQSGDLKGAYGVYTLAETPAYALDSTTGDGGSVTVPLRLPHVGPYRVHCAVHDTRGNTIVRDLYLYGARQGTVTSATLNTRDITVAPDRTVYAVGDTAHVQILSPIPDVPLLVTTEREKVYTHQILTLKGTSAILELPITADHVPNIQVSVSLQGRGRVDTGSADLRVPATQSYLNVTLKPDHDQYRPGENAVFTVTATDATGKPAQGVFAICVVDEAIFALADNTPATIKYACYRHRIAPVMLSASLIASAARFGAGGKGGGGGAPNENIRTDFPDTAYWSPNVRTGDDGVATVSFSMPDSVTTWRATAVGVTPATQVGYVTTKVIATKPFLVRPVLPRFVTTGDRVTLGAIVENDTDTTADTNVKITATPFSIDGASSQRVSVPAHASRMVAWPAKVQAGVSATVAFEAVAGDHTDGVQLTLPLLSGGVPASINRAGELRGDSTNVDLATPAEALAGSAYMDIAITPGLAGSLDLGTRYLGGFSYTCAEQTVSAFLPTILAKEAYAKAGVAPPDGMFPKDLDARVTVALARLAGLQHLDGGWNWWAYDQTDPYMTAYVVSAMFQAKRLGYQISEESYRAGTTSLVKQLDSPAAGLATRAYMLYVLAVAGQPQPSRAQALAAQADTMAFYGQAYLALAFDAAGDHDRARQMLDRMGAQASVTETSATWHEQLSDLPPMRGTDVYSTAAALNAYAAIAPGDPVALKAARSLLANQWYGSWRTTHDSAVALIALDRYWLARGDLQADAHYQVLLNGTLLKEGQASASAPSSTMHIEAAGLRAQNTLRIVADGTSPIYWSVSLRFRVAGQAGTQGGDLRVSRTYTLADGAPITGPIPSGSLVRVTLKVDAAAPLDYVLVSDQLPAGLEALNPNLATTQQGPSPDSTKQPIYSYLDIRDSEVDFFITKLPAGSQQIVYYAQASTSGAFQASPAMAWQMYVPTVIGLSSSTTIEVG
jgi:uncharacterized protein YfaS (alpha-2-macroglobulin family)